MKKISTLLGALALASCGAVGAGDDPQGPAIDRRSTMDLGAFSISLAVKDLAASRAFYEKLGFRPKGGDPAQNWLVLQNGTSTIGLFQGTSSRTS